MSAQKIILQSFYLVPADIDIFIDPIEESQGTIIKLDVEDKKAAISYAEKIAAYTEENWRLYDNNYKPIKSLLYGRSIGVKKVYPVDPDVEGIAKEFYCRELCLKGFGHRT